MERGRGIEPLALAWKAKVLPLYEPRMKLGASGENRTLDPALATRRFTIKPQMRIILPCDSLTSK